MRTLHKSWQDRPSGWARRVRWYEGFGLHGTSIRLCLEDGVGRTNEIFTDRVPAQARYDAFRNEEGS